MKKEDAVSLILYVLIIGVAVVYGLAVLQPHFDKSSFDLGIIYALFILGAVVASILSCALLFEIGHVLGAKIGGYKVLSVCVLYLMFYKDGKFCFKFKAYDGLTGETKILPKSENAHPRAYLSVGTLLATILAVGCFVLFYVNKDYSQFRGDVAYFFLTMGIVALICVTYNIVPFKLDSMNDGYRMAMVSNPRNREAFNELLRVEYEMSIGNTDVEIKTFTELTNFTASLNMTKLYIALDKENYNEALNLVEIVLNNEKTVSRKVYIRAVAMKIYLYFLTKPREEANQFVLDNISIDLKKELSSDTRSLACVRAYLLAEGLVENSKSECLLAIGNVNKAYKATSKERRESEAKAYNQVIDMINETHPKWEFGEYKLLNEDKEKGSN